MGSCNFLQGFLIVNLMKWCEAHDRDMPRSIPSRHATRGNQSSWLPDDERWDAEDLEVVRRLFTAGEGGLPDRQLIHFMSNDLFINSSHEIYKPEATHETSYHTKQERVCDDRYSGMADCSCRIASHSFRQYKTISFIGRPQRVSEPVCPPASLSFTPPVYPVKLSGGPSIVRSYRMSCI